MNKFNYNYFYKMYFMKQTLERMRLLLSFLIIFGSVVTLLSCSSGGDDKTTATGEWYEYSDFKGVGRSGAVVFQIGDVPYIGLGSNLLGSNEHFLTDMYKYESGSWVKITDYPGKARTSAVAFVVNGKAYVGLGIGLNDDGVNEYFKTFYEYDPSNNSWTAIPDFEGDARMGAVAFGIGDFGYVGSGYNGNWLQDFWSYNPGTQDWEAKDDIDHKRTNSFSFVIGGKGYVGGGSNNGSLVQSFFQYDPALNTWTKKNDLQEDNTDTDANDKGYTIARELAATFVLNNLAYVVGGARGTLDKETWQYTPDTDTWKKMKSFEATSRVGGVGYSIGTMGYVGLGHNGGTYMDDIYPFDPTVLN
jgi:N-acetylneuraminic acid mutarotase